MKYIQAVKVEGKKITDQQMIAETFNGILLLSQKMLKDKVKTIISMMIMLLWKVIPISWNKLILNLTQVWNVNAQQQKKLNEL